MKMRMHGIGLAEVLVAAFVLFLIMAAISGSFRSMFKASNAVSSLQDLENLKVALRDDINCQNTLGVALPTTVPCAGPYQLRRADNSHPNAQPLRCLTPVESPIFALHLSATRGGFHTAGGVL